MTRHFLILLAITGLVALAALNFSAVIDALIALATGPLFARQSLWIGWALFIAAVCVVALVIISRRAYRQIERDFPQIWDKK
jgi:membrane protein implicated in regulation of membrane protease activity